MTPLDPLEDIVLLLVGIGAACGFILALATCDFLIALGRDLFDIAARWLAGARRRPVGSSDCLDLGTSR